MGRVKRSGGGSGERRFFLSSPSPLYFFRPSTYPQGYYFFLRHNKDGGYNSTNINQQLSPAQNMPALQASLSFQQNICNKPNYRSDANETSKTTVKYCLQFANISSRAPFINFPSYSCRQNRPEVLFPLPDIRYRYQCQ